MHYIAKIALSALLPVLALTSGCDGQQGVEIGPRGGVVVSDDGRFSLEIPAGALEQPVEITVEEVACEAADSLGPCYEVGPIGMPLQFPGMVTYDLADGMLDGVDVDALTVLAEGEQSWQPLHDHRVDMADDVVTASAVYLSTYMIVAD